MLFGGLEIVGSPYATGKKNHLSFFSVRFNTFLCMYVPLYNDVTETPWGHK